MWRSGAWQFEVYVGLADLRSTHWLDPDGAPWKLGGGGAMWQTDACGVCRSCGGSRSLAGKWGFSSRQLTTGVVGNAAFRRCNDCLAAHRGVSVLVVCC